MRCRIIRIAFDICNRLRSVACSGIDVVAGSRNIQPFPVRRKDNTRIMTVPNGFVAVSVRNRKIRLRNGSSVGGNKEESRLGSPPVPLGSCDYGISVYRIDRYVLVFKIGIIVLITAASGNSPLERPASHRYFHALSRALRTVYARRSPSTDTRQVIRPPSHHGLLS